MQTRTKIYIASGAALFLIACAYSLWSNFKIGRLEKAAHEAKNAAIHKQKLADELEHRSRIYEQKIAYLESQLSELRSLAAKQDEELRSIETDTRNARVDVERTRRVRSAAATAAEVCRKLAELGHPCE